VGVAGVSVAIRSVRTGQVAFFTTDTTTPLSPQLAVDAALSFAEALGFVFDDDEVAADGTGADTAARFWCELIGEEQVEALVDEQPEANDGTPAGVKSEGMEDTETESEDVDATVREILTAASNTAPDPSAILSKFRWPAGPVEVADAVARKTVCW
jgi:hypothetical protein